MKRNPLLRREHIVIPLEHDSLANAIAGLIGALVGAGSVTDRAALSEDLDADPRRTAVTISPAVVLPHYRTDAVPEPLLGLGVTTRPLADAEGESAPRIVALILAPAEATTVYLRTVSGLARVLRQPAVIQRLLDARSPDDVLAIEELASLRVEPSVQARDLMIDTDTARPDDTLRAAVEILIRNDARGLPVVGDKGEILGLVTEADVLSGLLKTRARPSKDEAPGLVPPLRVRDVMERSVMCLPDNAELDEIAALLVSKDAELFPVVAEGRIVGLLRRVDILRTLYAR